MYNTKIRTSFMSNNLAVYYKIPLQKLISRDHNKNIQYIRQNYGQLGVDILENKKTPSILNPKDTTKFSKLINRIKQFFGFIGKEDYEESDSLYKVMFKYLYNNKCGKESDIENVFGKKGMEMLDVFKRTGYVE